MRDKSRKHWHRIILHLLQLLFPNNEQSNASLVFEHLSLATEHTNIFRVNAKPLEKPEERIEQGASIHKNVLVIEEENVEEAI